MSFRVGERVVVDCGAGVLASGVVQDVMDLGIGVRLDDSDGSTWRTAPRYLSRPDV